MQANDLWKQRREFRSRKSSLNPPLRISEGGREGGGGKQEINIPKYLHSNLQ
jgi:hypothetical protein